MDQLSLLDDKIVTLPTAKLNPNIKNMDEFAYNNGSRVILVAPTGQSLTLENAVFLLEHTKTLLLKTFG